MPDVLRCPLVRFESLPLCAQPLPHRISGIIASGNRVEMRGLLALGFSAGTFWRSENSQTIDFIAPN